MMHEQIDSGDHSFSSRKVAKGAKSPCFVFAPLREIRDLLRLQHPGPHPG